MKNNNSSHPIFGFYYKGEYATSENVRRVLSRLCHLKTFTDKVRNIRENFNLPEPDFDPYTTVTTFNNYFEKLSKKKKDEYKVEIYKFIEEFGLRPGWFITIKYLVGAAFIFEPRSEIKIWKHPEEKYLTEKTKGVVIFIGTDMNQDELCALIRKNWIKLKSKLILLPKSPKVIIHKDNDQYIEDTIMWLRDDGKKKFPDIADKITDLSEEHPDWCGGKTKDFSDSEVRTIYLRGKKRIEKILRNKKH